MYIVSNLLLQVTVAANRYTIPEVHSELSMRRRKRGVKLVRGVSL